MSQSTWLKENLLPVQREHEVEMPLLQPGQPQNFQQFKQLQLLGGFPLDRGRLSPCPNQDFDKYCPVIKPTRQGPLTRQDLKGKLDCIYDTSTASVNDEPPPPHAATKPITRIPLPVQSEQEVAIPLHQPWPPPVFIILCSAVKPGVYSPLSEGFQGGREISNTLLSLYFRSVISLPYGNI